MALNFLSRCFPCGDAAWITERPNHLVQIRPNRAWRLPHGGQVVGRTCPWKPICCYDLRYTRWAQQIHGCKFKKVLDILWPASFELFSLPALYIITTMILVYSYRVDTRQLEWVELQANTMVVLVMEQPMALSASVRCHGEARRHSCEAGQGPHLASPISLISLPSPVSILTPLLFRRPPISWLAPMITPTLRFSRLRPCPRSTVEVEIRLSPCIARLPWDFQQATYHPGLGLQVLVQVFSL